MLRPHTNQEIAEAVFDQIRELLVERDGEARPFSGTDRLNESLGLTSLDLAELVVALEDRFGIDPFAKLVPITDMQTPDDLIRAYRSGLHPEPTAAAADAELEAARRRGARRRARSA